MAEVFANSGENSDNISVASPLLQGAFIPGIDNPQAENGLGIVTPFGGGNTVRKYTEFGIPAEVSPLRTQLNDLSNAFVSGGVGGITLNLGELGGPQGLPGRDGVDGITQIIHLYGAPNSSFLTALPHNVDLINDLGTAADKLIYTDGYDSFGGTLTWIERQPIGASDGIWYGVASDSDGSNLIAADYGGRLWTSSDYGVNWTERRPAGDTNYDWISVASDDDGSNLIAAVSGGRLYTSSDGGVNWTERRPAGDTNLNWKKVASDSDGSNLIVGAEGVGGRLYTSANSGVGWTERQPAGAADKDWDCIASDADGSNLVAGISNGRLYTSANSGVGWTERQPLGVSDENWSYAASDSDGSNLIVGAFNSRLCISDDSGATWSLKGAGGGDSWKGVASDSDGSHLLVCSALPSGNLYESTDSGATFVATLPAGATTKNWWGAASNSDGTRFIVGVSTGRLYTGSRDISYSEATWAESDLTSAGRAILDDATALDQRTTLGVGEADSPELVGLTLSGLSDNSVVFVDNSGVLSENNSNFNWNDVTDTLSLVGTLTIKDSNANIVLFSDDTQFYITESIVIPIEAGMIMGPWLFWGTYAAP